MQYNTWNIYAFGLICIPLLSVCVARTINTTWVCVCVPFFLLNYLKWSNRGNVDQDKEGETQCSQRYREYKRKAGAILLSQSSATDRRGSICDAPVLRNLLDWEKSKRQHILGGIIAISDSSGNSTRILEFRVKKKKLFFSGNIPEASLSPQKSCLGILHN